MPVEGHHQSWYTAVLSGREQRRKNYYVSVALRKKGGGESHT